MIKPMEFSEWIEGKYIEWRGNTRATIKEFADFLGVSQPLLSQWMKRGGKTPKGKTQVDAIISKYPDDPDIYGILGLEQPADPSDTARRARLALLEIRKEIEKRGVSLNSPEAEKISDEIMERFGFVRKKT